MKMSNIDHCFDNMFTNPKDQGGVSHFRTEGSAQTGPFEQMLRLDPMSCVQNALTKDNMGELLYFGDVCAGPGGFSEYILWKRRWHAKGFGMTLRGPCDFKLEDFFAAPSELFEPYYGTHHSSPPQESIVPQTLMDYLIQRLTFAGLQVREEWTGTETSPGQKT